MILISGITGRVGRPAARHLLSLGVRVRGITRDISQAKDLLEIGVEIQQIEHENTDFSSSLKGVETLILVTGNNPNQTIQEVSISRQASELGVEKIVKISSLECGPNAISAFPRAHYEIEQAIDQLPISCQYLKPNFFMQNLFIFSNSIRKADAFSLPFTDTKTAIVDSNDIGIAAAEVAVRDNLDRCSYNLNGRELLTFYEVARELSNSLGREIKYNSISFEEFENDLSASITSEWYVKAVVDLFSEIADGSLEDASSDLKDILGREPTSIGEFVDSNRKAF